MIPFILPTALLTLLLSLVLAFVRGKALLMFYQQEEYDSHRFYAWAVAQGALDRRTSIWLLLAGLLAILAQQGVMAELVSLSVPLVLVGFIHGIILSQRILQNSKKPLVMTMRASRIFWVYITLTLVATALILTTAMMADNGLRLSLDLSWDIFTSPVESYDWRLPTFIGLLLLFVQALPFLLTLANKILEPFEERIKAGFRAEAIKKLATLNPTIIAITGSFGKTSTKHILNHILSAAKPTLATPGSVNTDMGITRVIRESLTADHAYFIVEMGAYGPGSIERLCALAPPDYGLITAVGAAHYERFKSLETVARAKFELAEAVFKRSGMVAVSTNGIKAELLADRIAKTPGNYRLTGQDITLDNVEMTAGGLTLTLSEAGETYELKAPLYGIHQADNITLAVMAARMVGLPWSVIRGSMRTMGQIRHRAEVSFGNHEPAVINDAYNSNPEGFIAALQVLDVLVKPGGRRILVTPGMVELGSEHEREHAKLGAAATQHADIILIVTPERIPTFLAEAQRTNDGHASVMSFNTQAEAEAWVQDNVDIKDAVLFENNLPDLYEAKVGF